MLRLLHLFHLSGTAPNCLDHTLYVRPARPIGHHDFNVVNAVCETTTLASEACQKRVRNASPRRRAREWGQGCRGRAMEKLSMVAVHIRYRRRRRRPWRRLHRKGRGFVGRVQCCRGSALREIPSSQGAKLKSLDVGFTFRTKHDGTMKPICHARSRSNPVKPICPDVRGIFINPAFLLITKPNSYLSGKVTVAGNVPNFSLVAQEPRNSNQ